MRHALLLCLVFLCGCGASALDVARTAVNLADAAMGQAALVAEGQRQAAEDRCLELEPGPGRDDCLEAVRKHYRPLWDAFGIWRLARATWDVALEGGSPDELARVRQRFCELREQLADRIELFDWPGQPCASSN